MRKLLRSVVLLVIVSFAAAESETGSPLLSALSYVPAEALLLDSSGTIEFADIDAALALRRLDAPSSWADLVTGANELEVLMSLPIGLPPAMTQALTVGAPSYPQVLGFDLFDIRYTLSFGQPPYSATLLFGDLNSGAVVSAFAARGYVVAREQPEGLLLCPEAGCDTGMQVNLSARDLGNLFGGDLGRTFPVWLSDGAIVGSASDRLLDAVAATYLGAGTSVADLGEVRAMNALLYDYPFVSSVMFVNPLTLMSPDLMPLRPSETAAEDAKAVLAALEEHALPPYSMAAYASVGDDKSEYGLVILAYTQEELAAAAAAALERRLGVFESSRTNATYEETFQRAGSLAHPRVYRHEPTATWLVEVSVRAPISFEPDDSGRPQLAGAPYRLLVSAFLSRDNLWLVPSN